MVSVAVAELCDMLANYLYLDGEMNREFKKRMVLDQVNGREVS